MSSDQNQSAKDGIEAEDYCPCCRYVRVMGFLGLFIGSGMGIWLSYIIWGAHQ